MWVYTEGDGSYIIPAILPAGTYFAVTANDLGYLDELYDDFPCHAGCDPTIGTEIVVSAGEFIDGVDFDLATGSAIAGTVTDVYTQAGIQDVHVDFY